MIEALDALAPLAPLAASALAAVAGCAACVAAVSAGRAAARARAGADAALRDAVEEISAQMRVGLAAARGEDPAAALAALREEVAALATHLSSVTVGQLELSKVVGRTVDGAVAGVEQRLIEAIGDGAVAQIERVEALEETVAAVSARIEETMANALTFLAENNAGEAAASAAALSLDALADAVAGLRAALDAAEGRLAAALRAGGATRAPSIFDGGRVVSVVAPAPPPQAGAGTPAVAGAAEARAEEAAAAASRPDADARADAATADADGGDAIDRELADDAGAPEVVETSSPRRDGDAGPTVVAAE